MTKPKESLGSISKAKITITNYLGGQYFLTVDEVVLTKEKVFLIEGKHSKNSVLPSKGDIKDGLMKMILYSNLSQVTIVGKSLKSQAVLSLTSSKLKGAIDTSSDATAIVNFFDENKFSTAQRSLIETVIA